MGELLDYAIKLPTNMDGFWDRVPIGDVEGEAPAALLLPFFKTVPGDLIAYGEAITFNYGSDPSLPGSQGLHIGVDYNTEDNSIVKAFLPFVGQNDSGSTVANTREVTGNVTLFMYSDEDHAVNYWIQFARCMPQAQYSVSSLYWGGRVLMDCIGVSGPLDYIPFENGTTVSYFLLADQTSRPQTSDAYTFDQNYFRNDRYDEAAESDFSVYYVDAERLHGRNMKVLDIQLTGFKTKLFSFLTPLAENFSFEFLLHLHCPESDGEEANVYFRQQAFVDQLGITLTRPNYLASRDLVTDLYGASQTQLPAGTGRYAKVTVFKSGDLNRVYIGEWRSDYEE